MRFAITGSSGLIGSILREFLQLEGHEITRVVRSLGGVQPGERAVVWHPDEGVIETAGLEGHDVVIHLAGESIAGVWTEGKKRRIRESRVRGTTLLSGALAGLERKPHTFLSGSGFGFYGARDPGVVVTEGSPAGKGFLPDVARAWEGATAAAEQAGMRVVHMRFGNVLSRHGGLLQVLVPLFKLGLAGRLGGGEQVWPWIAAPEIPHAVLHVIEHAELRGPVNFVSPQPVTNEEFTKAVASAVGRPVLFRVPEFLLELAPGEMGEELLLAGARVLPEKLTSSGYLFRYPDLRQALKALL